MNSVNKNDVKEFLSFVLQTEVQAYKENPIPTSKEVGDKVNEYGKKVEELTTLIANREGIKNEN